MSSSSSPSETKPPLVIGVVLFDGVMTLDWVGPTAYLELLPSIGVPVRFVTISNKTGRVQGDDKVANHAQVHYSDAPQKLDLLVVPGGRGRLDVAKDPAFLAYIAQVAATATYVLSVCTGSAILADAGVLAGKRATTNKIGFSSVAAAHPDTQWVRQARWVVDGNLWTSSGVAAGLDMGHAFITTIYGEKEADEMARYLEIVPNKDPSNDPFVGSITPA